MPTHDPRALSVKQSDVLYQSRGKTYSAGNYVQPSKAKACCRASLPVALLSQSLSSRNFGSWSRR
ncbi:predicted protein [Plenodomus lingam JN3]|uniref:Predicted protein n=1 Tax=Leptosphaeria maculans (strain JN3 / isolate v23.1.3 / race Av1-4-5-6-7-8) TaxID=985895 RepID=E4ZSB4_LEPMJ|nr:predicted protein [Plenodomus lingam JN3]CBX94294.1 predicted protein [Plenodomus lingam JN3]